MGIEDAVQKGKKLFEEHREKIDGALKSEQAEQISDKVIHGVRDAAKKVVPEGHHGTVDDIARKADGAVGNE